MNSYKMLLNDGSRAGQGDVILFNNAMVYLRDWSMFLARIEFEDGRLEWVTRNEKLKAI